MCTEHRDQVSICPFALCVVSVRTELALGHLRYYLRDVPPQSNSLPGNVLELDHTWSIRSYTKFQNIDNSTEAPLSHQNLFTII